MPSKEQAKKQAAKKKPDKPREAEAGTGQDLRRAYEHLGRVETLRLIGGEGAGGETVIALVRIAQQALSTGARPRQAAEALRAAEHASFAGLMEKGEQRLHLGDPKLAEAIEEELERLTDRIKKQAAERAGRDEIAELQEKFLARAEAAYRQEHYRQALEWTRGAEALGHIGGTGAGKKRALQQGGEGKGGKLAARK